jgi:putative transposase
MWTPANRRQHSRDHLRYETDLTDAEWALIEPLLPTSSQRGRPCTCLREVLNVIFYALRGGVTWRLLPSDITPKSIVFGWCSLYRPAHHEVTARLQRLLRSPRSAVTSSCAGMR